MVLEITLNSPEHKRFLHLIDKIGGYNYDCSGVLSNGNFYASINERFEGNSDVALGSVNHGIARGRVSIQNILEDLSPEEFVSLWEDFIKYGRLNRVSTFSLSELIFSIPWSSATNRPSGYWGHIYGRVITERERRAEDGL